MTKKKLVWLGPVPAAHQLHVESQANPGCDPWSATDSWKSHGQSTRSFHFEFHGATHVAAWTPKRNAPATLDCGGHTGALQVHALPGGALDMGWGDERKTAHVYRHGDIAHVFMAHGASQILCIDPLAHAGETHTEAGRLTAPMPGKVLSFAVKAGEVVRRGQTLAVMEAMKMEHTIAAPADGTVQELLFAPGDQVTEGAELLRLELAVATA